MNVLQSLELFEFRAEIMYRSIICNGLAAFIAVSSAIPAGAQSPTDSIVIRAIAEMESGGKLKAADRVVPGDRLIYTLEVSNAGATTVPAPTVTYPIPAHMWYVANSAVGPATDVSYSIDGGRSFDSAENLQVKTANGELRPAVAADYTHIRWQLNKSLKGKSVAFLRFRTIVK
jgi:uncharacterized repeat protein (TIGR01451 family)